MVWCIRAVLTVVIHTCYILHSTLMPVYCHYLTLLCHKSPLASSQSSPIHRKQTVALQEKRTTQLRFQVFSCSAHHPVSFSSDNFWFYSYLLRLHGWLNALIYFTFTRKPSSDTEEKVHEANPPSCLSYLSADGGPPLSLKRCRGLSQGRDGWGESLPVA